MKKALIVLPPLALFFAGCSRANLGAQTENYYRIRVIPSVSLGAGRDAEELSEAENAALFYAGLQDTSDAFICDTRNYDVIDGKLRYKHNSYPEAPVEPDSYGHCISVDENYFAHNPIEKSDGSALAGKSCTRMTR